MAPLPPFGGEKYLRIPLPDYDADRQRYSLLCIAVTFVWLILIPAWSYPKIRADRFLEKAQRRKDISGRPSAFQANRDHDALPGEVKLFLFAFLGLCATLGLLVLVLSPNNSFAARGVFQVPLFTSNECKQFSSRVHSAAARNSETARAILESTTGNHKDLSQSILSEPQGWNKKRPNSPNHSAPHLNLFKNAFLEEDLLWLEDVLDRRLGPTLGRIYGIPTGSIHSTELFVTRYVSHDKDVFSTIGEDSIIRFHILLEEDDSSKEIEGGVYLSNGWKGDSLGRDSPTKAGISTIHSTQVTFEESSFQGTRLALVGYISLDGGSSMTQSGLWYWYAKWLNVDWLALKAWRSYKQNFTKRSGKLSLLLSRTLKFLGDTFANQRFEVLVNDLDTDGFHQGLDRTFREQGRFQPRPSWYPASYTEKMEAWCIYESRCTVNPNDPVAWQPGDLDQTFQRIVNEYPDTKVLSRPSYLPGDGATIAGYKVGPWIISLDDFVSPAEANRLITWGKRAGFGRSRGVGDVDQATGQPKGILSKDRTSSNTWCGEGCHEDPMVIDILKRIESMTGIPSENGELLQILKYEKGQFYSTHNDYVDHERDAMEGPRILTVFIYLSNVEGGETRFDLNDIKVSPQLGRVLIWPSVLNENPVAIDHRTEHEAMPVVNGLKYAANAWFHLRSVQKAAERGCL